MKLKFKPSKRKIVKLRFFNPSIYPKRSKRDINLINKKPWVDSDGDGIYNFFDCKPLNKNKQGWAHQGIRFNRERSTHIRMMSPDKFLRTTRIEVHNRDMRIPKQNPDVYASFNQDNYEESVINKQNVELLKEKMKDKEVKMDIPFLEYDEQGRPTGHEGRHRAMAAKKLGVKLIPVTIARSLEEPRDWKEMRKAWKYKGTKHDWRNELENVDEVISSKSADIPLKEQKEYGVEKPEVLKSLKDELKDDLKD